jgi:hypothetical protein
MRYVSKETPLRRWGDNRHCSKFQHSTEDRHHFADEKVANCLMSGIWLASRQGAKSMNRRFFLIGAIALAGCGRNSSHPAYDPDLFPGETLEMRMLINKWADHYNTPRSLFHKVIQRESDYRAGARNGPYYGLMQILPETARTMGHRGPASELLDPEVNLTYAGKYLRGAWLVSGGNEDDAVMWYARGYYYEAKRLGLLVETGLRPE